MVEVEDYKLLKLLGTGISGQVFLAQKKDNGNYYALKFIERFYKDQQQEQYVIMQLEQEVNAIELVDSDRVIKSTECFTTEQFFVIVMDYCKNGDLFNYVKSKEHLNEQESIELLAQMLDGIKAVHSQNLIHRDIKPENLLLDDDLQIKIGDFGASIFYQIDNLHDNLCGTYYYMAPELENYEQYDFSVDLWSIGCVLFFMLTGNSPFSYCTSQLQISNYIYSFCNPQPDIDRLIKEHIDKKTLNEDHNISISEEVKDLISQMLKYSPSERISFSNILNHSSFKKYRKCPSVKKLLIQQSNQNEIYLSSSSLTKLNLTSQKPIKKHDFSPQKQKSMLFNGSCQQLSSIKNLNQLNNSNDFQLQKSLLFTQEDQDDLILTNRQENNHQIPLARDESDYFLTRNVFKKSTFHKIDMQDHITPTCKIPPIQLKDTPQRQFDNNYSIFQVNSDEFVEDDDCVSKKIELYSNNSNIMALKNKISNDHNSPNYRKTSQNASFSPTGSTTPQTPSTQMNQNLSQFRDIQPINSEIIKYIK
ncbi:hypothetical protein ABPG72_004110 [Tetrahymena utriculariae]